MEVIYEIDGKEVNRPLNYRELSVELNYDKDASEQAVSLTEFEWGLGSQVDGRDAAKIINDYREAGISGGVGVFEGLPFKILLVHNATTLVLQDGYLDASSARYDCDRVFINSVERKNIDWLNDVADGWSYDFGYENGEFGYNEFIPIPYIISKLPDTTETTLALISLFSIAITVADQIVSLVEYVAGIATLSVANVVQIIIRVAYIVALIFTLINIIEQLINSIIQPVKYLHGMTAQRLCQIGAQHFGFKFESSILDNAPYNKMVLIPEKYNQPVTDKTNNVFDVLGISGGSVTTSTYGFINPNDPNARGYYRGTFGELLRALKVMFKAKIVIDGDSLKLEPRLFNNSAANYVVPAVDQTDYTLNFEDLKSNYSVELVVDGDDKNTSQNYDGTFTQVVTSPKGSNNDDTILMKGFEKNNIPFARGIRKNALTNPEIIINSLIDIVNSLFGESPNPLSWDSLLAIDDRIGMLSVENDFIGVAKLVLIDENVTPSKTSVSTNNETFINSDYLYRNYHYVDSFVPSQDRPDANQYKIYERGGFPFCFEDYEKFRNNNYLQDDEGRDGELISARWNVEQETVEMRYKINELYTNNLQEEIRTPDGK